LNALRTGAEIPAAAGCAQGPREVLAAPDPPPRAQPALLLRAHGLCQRNEEGETNKILKKCKTVG